jgi:DNA-binding transcriptional ArsR family regulator
VTSPSTPAELPTAEAVEHALRQVAHPDRAVHSARYFKTGEGQYGEGDVFWGVVVPDARRVAARFRALPPHDIYTLMYSPVHEVRLCALIILTTQFSRARQVEQRAELFNLYVDLARDGRINNWDLVDVSAPTLGQHLASLTDAEIIDYLTAWAQSESLWERRLAVLFTFALLREDRLAPTFAICELLLADTHDLMHKAVGWALREAGKRDPDALRDFLHTHGTRMPRTALRYAIERFSAPERAKWLAVTR